MSKNRTTETKAKTADQTVDPPDADVVEIDAGQASENASAASPQNDSELAKAVKMCELWQKLKCGDPGPDRPLRRLVKAEADIKIRSQALAALTSAPRHPPDQELAIHQLTRIVNTRFLGQHLSPPPRKSR